MCSELLILEVKSIYIYIRFSMTRIHQKERENVRRSFPQRMERRKRKKFPARESMHTYHLGNPVCQVVFVTSPHSFSRSILFSRLPYHNSPLRRFTVQSSRAPSKRGGWCRTRGVLLRRVKGGGRGFHFSQSPAEWS